MRAGIPGACRQEAATSVPLSAGASPVGCMSPACQAAEPAIVFCLVLSDGEQVPAVSDRFWKSLGLRAEIGAALLSSQISTTKDSSPRLGKGLNSLLAHLSRAIKRARAKP